MFPKGISANVMKDMASILSAQALVRLVSVGVLNDWISLLAAPYCGKGISSQPEGFDACKGSFMPERQSESMKGIPQYGDLPERLPKGERKPLPTPTKQLIRKARKERKMNREITERVLHPPDNGLLVPKLVPVAHGVFEARNTLLQGVAKLLHAIPVHACRPGRRFIFISLFFVSQLGIWVGLLIPCFARNCPEVHVGLVGHQIRTCEGPRSCSSKEHVWAKGTIDRVLPPSESFHLYDRVGRAVTHDERLVVDRVPAIVELCMQAGLDLPDYPTRRRLCPVYMIAGKIVDFERSSHRKNTEDDYEYSCDFWDIKREVERNDTPLSTAEEIRDTAVRTLQAWEDMKLGARQLMKKYPVKTCGYCPEVQVGPKGHRARICQAYKHQFRDGQHAWQEAIFDDFVAPAYVWHVRDPRGSPLKNELRKYYGKAPALVELCVQAGATVPDEYKSMMRLDVAIPDIEEAKLVA